MFFINFIDKHFVPHFNYDPEVQKELTTFQKVQEVAVAAFATGALVGAFFLWRGELVLLGFIVGLAVRDTVRDIAASIHAIVHPIFNNIPLKIILGVGAFTGFPILLLGVAPLVSSYMSWNKRVRSPKDPSYLNPP